MEYNLLDNTAKGRRGTAEGLSAQSYDQWCLNWNVIMGHLFFYSESKYIYK